MNDFIIETIGSGRGRYRRYTHVLHLAECKKKTPRSERSSLEDSEWFRSGAAEKFWGDQSVCEVSVSGAAKKFLGDQSALLSRLNYSPPQVCEWCMNPRTTAMARAKFWLYVIQSGPAYIARMEGHRIARLKERADYLEEVHQYVPLIKAVREAWIDGDAEKGDRGFTRGVRYTLDNEAFYGASIPWRERLRERLINRRTILRFRLQNKTWSEVGTIEVDVRPTNFGLVGFNFSTAIISEVADARRLADVFDVINNWGK